MKHQHQVKVTLSNYHGLDATLVCIDHECSIPEVWDWDRAAALECFHGPAVEFPPLDVEITSCDEEDGIDWQLATPDHEDGAR